MVLFQTGSIYSQLNVKMVLFQTGSIYAQLNVKMVLFQTIQFSISAQFCSI